MWLMDPHIRTTEGPCKRGSRLVPLRGGNAARSNAIPQQVFMRTELLPAAAVCPRPVPWVMLA